MRRRLVHGQFYILARCMQALEVRLAESNWIVIVLRSAKDSNRAIGHFDVRYECGRAVGIERNISGELGARFIPERIKAFETGIKSGLAAARKAH
jgi:hypothetical protein